MRKFLYAILLMFSVSTIAADNPSETWFNNDRDSVVVKAYYSDKQMLADLAGQADVWMIDPHKKFALIKINAFEYVELVKIGFEMSLDRERTTQLYTRPAPGAAQGGGIPGFECYRTVPETLDLAAQLVTDNPTLAELIDIGDSWEKTNGGTGNDLLVLKITNQAITGPKPRVFAMSAVHAREYTTAELNTRFALYLLENYQINADARWLVDNHEFHLLLQANPDGRLQAETGLFWRKNTNENYCEPTSPSRGADLNRNFEFQWGCCNGSSTAECSSIYRGASPASEPEVAAIQDYVRSIFPDVRGEGIDDAAPLDTPGVFLDIHSFSGLVLYPWGFVNQTTANNDGLQTMARKLAFFTNYAPIQITGLTIADGSTLDFAYGELGVASFAFEVGTTFFQDCTSFEQTLLPQNLQSMIYMAKAARAPYLLADGPDVIELSFDTNTLMPGMSVELSATATDIQFSNIAGTQATQNVSGANAYIDTPPWEAGAVPIALASADGAFDSETEILTASLDLSALTLGEHTIYLSATDANGDTGVVSAAFVYILDPATAATISGTVVDANTGAGVAATVTAGPFQTNTDPATGAYSFLAAADNYTVTATPLSDDYTPNSISGITAAGGSTTVLNFTLSPYCDVFSDDVESAGVAWTAQGTWARDTQFSNSPTTSWTDSPGGNYPINTNISLSSPVLNLTDATAAQLVFAQRCITESNFDFCIIESSTDGVTWNELARFDESTNDATQFNIQTIDLSSISGSATAQFRFRIQADDFMEQDGWYIDDIRVRVTGAACVTSVDTDLDGIADALDNCTLISNSSQLDVDGDNFGNACDADFNNDNITNFLDIAIFAGDFLSSGVLQTDINGDGVVNFIDLVTVRDFFLMPPGPSGLTSP